MIFNVGRNGGYRKQAKILGEKYYYTGIPCSKGHLEKRKTKTGKCCECERINSYEKSRKLRESSPEKVRKYVRLFMRKWREKNPEKAKLMILKRDKDKIRKSARELYKKKKDKFAEKARIYREKNKEYFAVSARNRRAMKKSAGTHTLAEIKNLLDKQAWTCVYCRKSLKAGYHADHIVPLSKKGSNMIDNIQCLCPSCNLSKNSRDAEEWAKEKGYA